MGILILALCWQHLVAYASLTLLQFVDKVKRLCLLLSPSLGSYRLFNLPFCFITVIREIFCRADKPEILISYNPKTVFSIGSQDIISKCEKMPDFNVW